MADFYKPYDDRTPDSQYRDRVKFVLENGVWGPTPQKIPGLTCFGTVPAMVFDLSNGAPIITDRKLGFWRKAVIEIIAFANGVRDIHKLVELGCDYWDAYLGKGVKYGLPPEDLGPGSYGAAFHDFPMPNGGGFNQYAALIRQIMERPELRTHFISPWIPFLNFRGPDRKVVVSPCHGTQQYRVRNGKLDLLMWQRSGDFPLGIPSNMAQYTAMLLMVARATGLEPGTYIHQFGDAHIYENQIEQMQVLVEREPKRLPTLTLSPDANDFFSTTIADFELTDYEPHPPMKIAYTP